MTSDDRSRSIEAGGHPRELVGGPHTHLGLAVDSTALALGTGRTRGLNRRGQQRHRDIHGGRGTHHKGHRRFTRWLSRWGTRRGLVQLVQPTRRNSFIKRVLLQLQVVSDLGRSVTFVQPLLDFLDHGWLEYGCTTRYARGIEARWALRTVAFYRAFDADL